MQGRPRGAGVLGRRGRPLRQTLPRPPSRLPRPRSSRPAPGLWVPAAARVLLQEGLGYTGLRPDGLGLKVQGVREPGLGRWGAVSGSPETPQVCSWSLGCCECHGCGPHTDHPPRHPRFPSPKRDKGPAHICREPAPHENLTPVNGFILSAVLTRSVLELPPFFR